MQVYENLGFGRPCDFIVARFAMDIRKDTPSREWSLEEKQSFIESLLKKYPTPSMIAYREKDSTITMIIDGWQRIQAILSFMRNEFPVYAYNDYRYFNVSVLYNSLAAKLGKVEQRQAVLPVEDCKEFLYMALPFSFVNDNSVNILNIQDFRNRIHPKIVASTESQQTSVFSR